MGLFGVARSFVLVILVMTTLIGAIIGACAGFLGSLLISGAHQRAWKDALLGGVGTLASYLAAILLPWPETTIHRPIVGGGDTTETSSALPHPFLIAWAVAALLPVLRGFWNYPRAKSREDSKTAND